MFNWMWRKKIARRNSVVNMKSGGAFQGILWDQFGRWVILRKAVMYQQGTEPVQIDGEVVLDRDEIEFIQLIN